MSEWRKVSAENGEFLAVVLRDFPEAEPRKMFGCPVYFLNGHMLTGAHQEDVFLRLSAADQQEILDTTAAVHFSPKPGMVMKEYVALPPSIFKSEAEFRPWLQRAIAYVQSLPPKEKKPRKPKSK